MAIAAGSAAPGSRFVLPTILRHESHVLPCVVKACGAGGLGAEHAALSELLNAEQGITAFGTWCV